MLTPFVRWKLPILLLMTCHLIISLTSSSNDVQHSYFKNLDDCYECTHGLSEDESYELIDCMETNTTRCTDIRKKCLDECRILENAVQNEMKAHFKEISYFEKLKMTKITAVGFSHAEKEAHIGKILKECVVGYNIPAQWTLDKEKVRKGKGRFSHCKDRQPVDFLVTHVDCPIHWISPSNRATFYRQCLESFDIHGFKTRAKASARKLQNLAFELKGFEKENGETMIGGGSAMVAGGILGGIGIVLAPFTAGGSLILKAVGTAVALGGSLASLFGGKGQTTISESKVEISNLETQSNHLGSLILLYTQSNYDNHQFGRKYENKANETIEAIKKRTFNIVPATTANLVNFALITNNLRNEVLGRGANEIAGTSSSTLRYAETSQTALSIYKSSSVKTLWQKFTFSKTPFGEKALIFFKGGAKIAETILGPCINIGTGIYSIMEGSKQLEKGLYHQVIITSRNILYETDMLIEAFNKVTADNVLGTDSKKVYVNAVVQQIYSVNVYVNDSNWDHFSGAYLNFRNGKDAPCRTESVTLSKGWYSFNTAKLLRDCQYFKIYSEESNLEVALTSDQHSHITDTVTIDNIEVSVDGNYLPSLETSEPLSAKSSKRSNYTSLTKMKGLKKIKMHTSNKRYSGTDAHLKFYFQWQDNDGNEYTTNQVYLDNYGDDREYGQTDEYAGQSLTNLWKVTDILDYFPSDYVLNVFLKLENNWTAHMEWNLDLLKLYFVGEQGKDTILNCHSGGKWIKPSTAWTEFPCKIYRPRNPAVAIEMIRAHTCDILYGSTGSDDIQFTICTEKEGFKNVRNSLNENKCCRTNLFGSGFARNDYSYIDTLDNDGGEDLGSCEGFEAGGTGTYIAIENDSSDKGCINELGFYGTDQYDDGQQTSSIAMPFGVCAFDDMEFDDKKVRQTYGYGDNEWRNETDTQSAILCNPSFSSFDLESLQIKVCDRADAGDNYKFKLKVCHKENVADDFTDCCTTSHIPTLQRGKEITLSKADLGSCNNKKLKPLLSVSFEFPKANGICISHLKFNNFDACETCAWADTSEVRFCSSNWKNPEDNPIRCKFSEGNTIKKLTLKVCNEDGSGSDDKIKMLMKNGDGETCLTNGLPGPKTGHVKEYTVHHLGEQCKNFKVTAITEMNLFTEPGKNDLCITDVFLDVSNSSGDTRLVRCRFDQNKQFRLTIQGGSVDDKPTIPLICR